MKTIPYLTFNGNAEEALNLYLKVFNGKTSIMRFGEMPADSQRPVGKQWQSKVMHANLEVDGEQLLYLSDCFEGNPAKVGDNYTVHVEFESEERLRKTFAKLAEGATVTMPVQRTFWGAIYGSLVDKFGVPWGLHFELPSE